MKFARAMSNGVGLHCPDLTAGTPVYTPDELGFEDPDAGSAPEQAPPAGPGAGKREAAADTYPGVHPDLTEAALDGRYSAATVVELCRFYYDQPALTELGEEQAIDMAGRLRLARVQGVEDERLRRMAAKGLTMRDRARARQAADIWLTFRAADTGPPAEAA
jgi:hypothetical protein